MRKLLALLALLAVSLSFGAQPARASGEEKPVKVTYRFTPPAPREQSVEEMAAKSRGCYSCHVQTDQPTMHKTPAVRLGCTDCHGGDATSPEAFGKPELGYESAYNLAAKKVAHPQPTLPGGWGGSPANPERSYTLLNKESPEFIRFVNPSDYRVAREACGSCHLETIEATERSLMSTGAMLWGGAAYNNGIVPYKNYIFGEAYTRKGEPACILSPSSRLTKEEQAEACKPSFGFDKILTEDERKRGALAKMYPLPRWSVIPPGDVFRVFERGGRNVNTQFAEIGLPNPTGSIQRLEEPGRPDLKQSNRGPGTGLRVAIPVLNIHKTRLNDPFMWFMGTNDQPGDYRHSGCAGCHVIYANDREPRHSLIYADYGRDGETATVDPTIKDRKYKADDGHGHGGDGHGGGGSDHGDGAKHAPDPDQHGALVDPADAKAGTQAKPRKDRLESGHPIGHAFTRAIPTSQCMTCHMHQPNIFLNSYLGYTMWDYESDAPQMWPGPNNTAPRPPGMSDADYQKKFKQQHYPTAAEVHQVLERNPEAAATRGLWGDVEFLRDVYDVNDTNQNTQFADYHGHGWNFRGIFKRDRNGNLLDADGNMSTYGTDTAHIVDPNDPEKWRKSCSRYSDPKERDLCLTTATADGREGKFVPPGLNPGKAVHMMDIHAEKGMQCADCHFAQDSHGNGYIQGEVANAVEISCKDCHGTADALPNLLTSNVAARPQGTNLALLRNGDGRRRFEFQYNDDGEVTGLIQRSIVDPKLEWQVSLVKQAVTPGPHFNAKAARAKLMARAGSDDGKFEWGPGVAKEDRAHGDDKMTCFTCHLSWTTSCGGCHLPIEANWKTKMHHFEGGGDAQLRDLQPAGGARRDVPARPPHDDQAGRTRPERRGARDHHPGAIDLGAGAVLDQPQPRAYLYPAAADLVGGLFEPGLRAALPAHRPPSGNQAVHRLPPVGGRRQQRDHVAADVDGHQLRELRRAQRLVGAGRQLPGDARHRMGRAAGGDRQLSAKICLSRLLGHARQPERPRAQELGARQGVRQENLGRKICARGIREHRAGHQRPGELPATARRIYVRRRGQGRLPRL